MHVEVLTWEEIQCLPSFNDGQITTGSSYWDKHKEDGFSAEYPDRIIELSYPAPDSDGDYETENYYIPPECIKYFIPDTHEYGTHKLLKRIEHVQT